MTQLDHIMVRSELRFRAVLLKLRKVDGVEISHSANFFLVKVDIVIKVPRTVTNS